MDKVKPIQQKFMLDLNRENEEWQVFKLNEQDGNYYMVSGSLMYSDAESILKALTRDHLFEEMKQTLANLKAVFGPKYPGINAELQDLLKRIKECEDANKNS